MAGKGGGAWKVAYADFVTAMMAFFLVMWITAQSKSTKEAIASYFEDPTGTTKGSGSVRQNAVPPESIPGQQQSGRGPGKGPSGEAPAKGEKSKVDVKRRPPKLRIFQWVDQTRSAGTMVLFAENSAELDAMAQEQLKALVPQLRGKPHKIEIRGHSVHPANDSDAIGTSTWNLCFARCLATMKFLSDQGLEPGRMRLSLAGSSEPYSNRREPEWQAHNSRVEVFAVSEYIQPYEEPKEERSGLFKKPDDVPVNPLPGAEPPAEPENAP